ncbi:MAG: hypothetical protein Kow0090_02960 [Myxococcota bacterium]
MNFSPVKLVNNKSGFLLACKNKSGVIIAREAFEKARVKYFEEDIRDTMADYRRNLPVKISLRRSENP